jgi:hypothetical protein
MPPFSYDKEADIRDGLRADYIRTQNDYYSNHTDQHLRNALKFAKG